jgi:hypothetical protein
MVRDYLRALQNVIDLSRAPARGTSALLPQVASPLSQALSC